MSRPHLPDDQPVASMRSRSPGVLVLNGTVGAGKTAVGQEVARIVAGRQIGVAFLDLDALAYVPWPKEQNDPFHYGLMFRNLATLWPNFEAIGVTRLVLAGVVPGRDHLMKYDEAVAGRGVIACRLTAPLAVRRERLSARETGTSEAWHLERTETLDAELDAAQLPGPVVANEGTVTETASAVIAAVGW